MNSKIRSCSTSAALMLLALAGSPASAGDTYYRWIDSSGTPVNSDRPPPAGVEYDVITKSTNTMVSPTTNQTGDSQGASPVGSADQQALSTPRMIIEKNPEACAIAQQNLETLNSYARIRMPDADGNYRYLNEEEKAAEREQAQAAISLNCD